MAAGMEEILEREEPECSLDIVGEAETQAIRWSFYLFSNQCGESLTSVHAHACMHIHTHTHTHTHRHSVQVAVLCMKN